MSRFRVQPCRGQCSRRTLWRRRIDAILIRTGLIEPRPLTYAVFAGRIGAVLMSTGFGEPRSLIYVTLRCRRVDAISIITGFLQVFKFLGFAHHSL